MNNIILFDGVCNLCQYVVQFVIRRDKKKKFQFASLQSESGKKLLQKFGLPADELNSFVLVQGDRAFTKSTAALRLAGKLSGPMKLFYIFLIVPRFIRDAVYRWIADNRYRWFGKKEECMIPTPELRARFLD